MHALAPALACVSGLRIPQLGSSEQFAVLPATLRQLRLTHFPVNMAMPLALGHLTSLTALELARALGDDDVLPGRLRLEGCTQVSGTAVQACTGRWATCGGDCHMWRLCV